VISLAVMLPLAAVAARPILRNPRRLNFNFIFSSRSHITIGRRTAQLIQAI